MLMDLPEIADPKNKRASAVKYEGFLWAVFHSTALYSWFASSMFAEVVSSHLAVFLGGHVRSDAFMHLYNL